MTFFKWIRPFNSIIQSLSGKIRPFANIIRLLEEKIRSFKEIVRRLSKQFNHSQYIFAVESFMQYNSTETSPQDKKGSKLERPSFELPFSYTLAN